MTGVTFKKKISDKHACRWPVVGAIVCIAIVLAAVAVESWMALAIVLMEGVVAGGILLAATAGIWIARALGFHANEPTASAHAESDQSDEETCSWAPLADRWIIGTGLGVGGLAIVTLLLGVVGWLGRWVALCLVGGLAVAGAVRMALDWRSFRVFPVADRKIFPCSHRWWWLVGVPFVVLLLLEAALPPGILWGEEGNGYDVLEYHLAVPKLWHDAGRIMFLDNNVYSNFPLNSEMLSLLAMTLHGDAIEAALLVGMLNAGVCGLFVAAAWWTGRAFSKPAGTVAGLLALTTPWTVYLGGIAYVEVGMLAMGMLALGSLLRCQPHSRDSHRWVWVAGLFAGLACGFKYPAAAMIAAPLVILIVVQAGGWRRGFRLGAVYVAGVAITLSPWLIRNTICTHNPVFPLGYSVFGAKAGTWDAELDARWHRGHRLTDVAHAEEESAIGIIWHRTIGEWRVGWLLLVLAGCGAIWGRDRITAAMLLILLTQILVWYFATHLYARFAVVVLLPMMAMASRGAIAKTVPTAGRPGRGKKIALIVVLLAGASWNLYALAGLYYDHTRLGGESAGAYGRTDWFVTGQWPGTEHIGAINALDPSAKVMLVGEARTFYIARPCVYATVFNHHPLGRMVEQAGEEPSVLLEQLRGAGITHVLVHWGEMRRLQSTYGFEPRLTPKLFAELEQVGLRTTKNFSYAADEPAYATLYEVSGS